jgi:hypothetical protein
VSETPALVALATTEAPPGTPARRPVWRSLPQPNPAVPCLAPCLAILKAQSGDVAITTRSMGNLHQIDAQLARQPWHSATAVPALGHLAKPAVAGAPGTTAGPPRAYRRSSTRAPAWMPQEPPASRSGRRWGTRGSAPRLPLAGLSGPCTGPRGQSESARVRVAGEQVHAISAHAAGDPPWRPPRPA